MWYAKSIAVCDQILSWYFIQKSSYGLPGTAGEHAIITSLYHIRLTSIISFKTVLYCIKGYKTSLWICLQNLFYLQEEDNEAELLLENIDNFASVFRSLLINSFSLHQQSSQNFKFSHHNFSKEI